MDSSFWELLTEVNWKLILFTVLGSGVLSIIGDRVGMKYAKRRISLFNLRPKYTSSILTACTGMVISLFVILILSVVSDSVRTGLLSMQYMQRQMVELTKQLQQSRDQQQISTLLIVEAQQQLSSKEREYNELQERSAELQTSTEQLEREHAQLEEDVKRVRESLGRLQENRIVAFAEERLAQEVVPEGTVDEAAARARIDHLNELVRYEVARRATLSPESIEIVPDEESLETAITRILAYDSRKVIRAIAPGNVATGEPVKFLYRVFESDRVFYDGEILLSRVLRELPGEEQSELILSYMLRRLNLLSQNSGILTDPLTGTVGGIPANDFYDGIDRIMTAEPPLRISLAADGDIYSEGPVSVKVIVQSNVSLDDLDPDDEDLPSLDGSVTIDRR